eukprot:794334-Rhodomonas_salina.1
MEIHVHPSRHSIPRPRLMGIGQTLQARRSRSHCRKEIVSEFLSVGVSNQQVKLKPLPPVLLVSPK